MREGGPPPGKEAGQISRGLAGHERSGGSPTAAGTWRVGREGAEGALCRVQWGSGLCRT